MRPGFDSWRRHFFTRLIHSAHQRPTTAPRKRTAETASRTTTYSFTEWYSPDPVQTFGHGSPAALSIAPSVPPRTFG